MTIKVLVVKADGTQYVEEREVPESYFEISESQEQDGE